MRVRELIEILSRADQEASVVFHDTLNDIILTECNVHIHPFLRYCSPNTEYAPDESPRSYYGHIGYAEEAYEWDGEELISWSPGMDDNYDVIEGTATESNTVPAVAIQLCD